MRKLLKSNRGFTLLEVSIVLAITMIFSGAIFFNLTTIKTRNQAKECSINLLMLHNAVNNYCLDNNVSYGTTVQITNLMSSGYLNNNENYRCPVHRTEYQTEFIYGTLPTCPDNISEHICTAD